MTDMFLAACPGLSTMIVNRTGSHAGSKWRFTNDLAYFLVRATREPTVAIALIGNDEDSAVAYPGVRQAFTAAQALQWLCRTDAEHSLIGVCGR